MKKLLIYLSPLIIPGLTALFYRHFQKKRRPRPLVHALYDGYLLWLLLLLLIPTRSLSTAGFHLGVDPEVLDWNLNLIPMRTISRYSDHVLGLHYFTNIWGNILMTVPLGLMAALKNPHAKLKGILLHYLLLFTAVETVQYFIGRTADVDDLILNVMGIFLGAITIRLSQFFLSL